MHTEGHTHAHTDVPWRGWNVILNGVDRPAGSWVRSLFGGEERGGGGDVSRSGLIRLEQTILCSGLTRRT